MPKYDTRRAIVPLTIGANASDTDILGLAFFVPAGGSVTVFGMKAWTTTADADASVGISDISDTDAEVCEVALSGTGLNESTFSPVTIENNTSATKTYAFVVTDADSTARGYVQAQVSNPGV